MLRKIPSPLAALLVAFAVCLYIPLVSFYGSPNEFPFRVPALLQAVALPFICLAAALCLILMVCNKPFAQADKQAGGLPAPASPIHVLAVMFVFCIWVEGILLNRGLPKLTGELDIFNSIPRLLLDTAVWFLLLSGGLLFWQALGRRLHLIAPCIGLLLLVGIGDAALSSPPKVAAQSTAGGVLEKMRFHPKDNVLILLLDAMSTALMKDFIEENPEAKEELSGFVFFENNLETASSTQWSLPSILRGDMFLGGDSLGYQRETLGLKNTMPDHFADNGYRVYVSSFLPMFNAIMGPAQGGDADGDTDGEAEDVLVLAEPPVVLTPALYGLLSVRFAPYALKNPIANNVGFSGASTQTQLNGHASYDAMAYATIAAAVDMPGGSAPSFHFHHVNGAHMPYITGLNGVPLPDSERFSLRGLNEQREWTQRSVLSLLRRLKAGGMYDDATIVLLGDHGDRKPVSGRKNYAYSMHASLLIKPAGRTQPFEVSKAPTSNMYLMDLITAVHLEGKSLESLTQNLPEQRSIFIGGDNSLLVTYAGEDVTSLRTVNSRSVEQELPPTVLVPGTLYTCSMLNDNQNIAFPLALEGASALNGWGIRLLAEISSVSFLVEPGDGRNIDLSLSIHTDASGGGSRAFAPYPLIVRDLTSRKEHVFTVRDYPQEIRLEKILVADVPDKPGAAAIHLQLDTPITREYATRIFSIQMDAAEGVKKAE